MYRLGASGHAAFVAKIGTLLSVGDDGTLDNITKKLFGAIYDLESEYLC